jgi:hypothetical protein
VLILVTLIRFTSHFMPLTLIPVHLLRELLVALPVKSISVHFCNICGDSIQQLEDVVDPSATPGASTTQVHEIAFSIFEWFPKQGIFKDGEFFMSDIEKAITTMSTELNIVLSSRSKGSQRRIWGQLKLPFASEDEIDGKDRNPTGNQLRDRIYFEHMYRRLERHGERAHGLHISHLSTYPLQFFFAKDIIMYDEWPEVT